MTSKNEESKISLDQLLTANSEVLNILGKELSEDNNRIKSMGHNSTLTGHRSSGGHASHASFSVIEWPLS